MSARPGSGRHLLSAAGMSRADLDHLIDLAGDVTSAGAGVLPRFTTGLFFFEESTRTRVGFEVATARLGGTAVTVGATKHTGHMSAAESWSDTIRSVGGYFDVVCVRHRDSTAASLAAAILGEVPVINCGNGSDEHPTQALIDLLAVSEHLAGPPDGVHIALVGDLRNMRSAHSLLLALAMYRAVTVTAVCPPELEPPDRFMRAFVASGNGFETVRSLADVTAVDLVYVAGFAPGASTEYQDAGARAPYRVTSALVRALPPHVGIFCPLPRIDEIDREVDLLPQARYFRQSELALHMRMAVLRRVLT